MTRPKYITVRHGCFAKPGFPPAYRVYELQNDATYSALVGGPVPTTKEACLVITEKLNTSLVIDWEELDEIAETAEVTPVS